MSLDSVLVSNVMIFDILMSLDSVLVSNVMKTDVKTENENQNVMAACKVM
jgi:hypothetical protein